MLQTNSALLPEPYAVCVCGAGGGRKMKKEEHVDIKITNFCTFLVYSA
jgi:hypothetical protein